MQSRTTRCLADIACITRALVVVQPLPYLRLLAPPTLPRFVYSENGTVADSFSITK
jgi:hypothetical protein